MLMLGLPLPGKLEVYETDILESENKIRIQNLSEIPLSHNEVKTLKISTYSYC